MGFIDWHGKKEDHYHEVLEYAKDRCAEEDRFKRNQVVRRWVSKQLQGSTEGRLESEDVMKLFVKAYLTLDRLYEEMLREKGCEIEEFDSTVLWKDFWIAAIELTADRVGLPDQKKLKWMTAFCDKVLKLDAAAEIQQHLQKLKIDRRYGKYFRECFELETGQPMHFWRWIYHLRTGDTKRAGQFVEEYKKCRILLEYYLYLSLKEGIFQIDAIERELRVLSGIQEQYEEGSYYEPVYRKLCNPLYAAKRETAFNRMSIIRKVLLFHFRKCSEKKEGEISMVEELYAAFDEKRIPRIQVDSILPKQIRAQVEEGRLPDFPKPDVQGIAQEEKLYYLNHTVLYQGKEEDEEVAFHAFQGILYFTDQKILFRGTGSIEIQYDHIERIMEYDVLPEILEVVCNGRSNFFQVPDIEIGYQVLRLIANKNRGKVVEEKQLPFTYDELVDKADIGACMFAFDYAAAGDMPQSLRKQILALNVKLKGLQKTLEKYPERKEEVYQFLHYYVPEAVRVVVSYQQYQGVGLADKTMQNICEKVTAAIYALDAAVCQKIVDIYRQSVVDTVARAEALREILGQDGYVDPAYKID